MLTKYDQRIKTIQHYSYHLSDKIGQGFSSIVYKGKNILNELQVAIKVIDLHKLSQSTLQQLLQSQINIIKNINHQNIVKCQSVYMTINNCYIITQLCRGGDLASQIKKRGRLRGMEALKVMLDIAKGVDHLSQLNIMHRDIKPANILLDDGVAKIADFGFAIYQEQQGKKQKYGVGSPLYMSPQAIFSNFYSKENDIWSLGIVFYEILIGRPPWDPTNEKQLKDLLKQKKQLFFRIALRDQLQVIIRSCLNHDRAQRLTIKQIVQVLEKMILQMKTQQNTPYRQTLTKRTHTMLGIKDQNTSTTISTEGNMSEKQLMLKISRGQLIQTVINKQNTKKELGNQYLTVIKNQYGGQRPIVLNLQDASKHNHLILKSVINYTRFIFKTYPKLSKMKIKQIILYELQIIFIGLLQYLINWLKDVIKCIKIAQNFGIINIDKFKQTKCFNKIVLVINQYYQRYNKFIYKTKNTFQHKQTIMYQENNLPYFYNQLKKIIQSITVKFDQQQHNLGLDFIISVAILADMLNNHSTAYFAQHSFIQDIVETEPKMLIGDDEVNELRMKLQMFLKSR